MKQTKPAQAMELRSLSPVFDGLPWGVHVPNALPDELMRMWREGLPDLADLRDAGWAFQAGDYAKALELSERALAEAELKGRVDVADIARRTVDACRAKLSGGRAPGEVPEGCALCGEAVQLARVLDVSFIWLCAACVPKCQTRIDTLRAEGTLADVRFPPSRTAPDRCSFCQIGGCVFVTLSSAGVGALCYECLEDFTDTVQEQPGSE